MNIQFPPKETVERIRQQYPAGTRIELVSMDDPYSKLIPGDRGTVRHVDDTGTIFAAWDSGSSLGLVYGVDSYKSVPLPDRSHENEAHGEKPSVLGQLRDAKKAPKPPSSEKPKNKADIDR